MQQTLFKTLSVKTPLQYFGGKRYATSVLRTYVPTDVETIVSPFFGAGALELALTGRGIRVHGYDKFPPIPHFWRTLKTHPDSVDTAIRETIRKTAVEALWKHARDTYEEVDCDVMKAAMLLIVYNTSFNGRGVRGSQRKLFRTGDTLWKPLANGGRESKIIDYSRIGGFHNPLVTVKTADFRDSLRTP